MASSLIFFGGLLVGFCNAERGHLFADHVEDGMPWRAINLDPADRPTWGPLYIPDASRIEANMHAPPD